MTSPDPETGIGANSAVRHRILQADGRRYSIKIEEAYWSFLEALADKRGLRLSRLVQGIAATVSDESSLAASLRLFCLQSASADIDRLKHQSVEQGIADGQTRLLAVLDANPAPTLLIGQDQRIQRANAAFEQWSGASVATIRGKPFDWFFQVRSNPPLADVHKRFAAGGREVFAARISYVAPGRIVVAKAHLCLALCRAADEFSWTLLVENTAAAARPQKAPPQPVAKTS